MQVSFHDSIRFVVMANMDERDQSENEFRNIKLKLKGRPDRHSELQAIKALMAMSARNNNVCEPHNSTHTASISNSVSNNLMISHEKVTTKSNITIISNNVDVNNGNHLEGAINRGKEPVDLSRSESPEPVYGLSITMTEEEFRELAEREGIKDVICDTSCKLCGRDFSGPLGIALHMCPAMKRQTFRCEICGEDKWKTKANLHSHIKWCKKRLSSKTEQHDKQIY